MRINKHGYYSYIAKKAGIKKQVLNIISLVSVIVLSISTIYGISDIMRTASADTTSVVSLSPGGGNYQTSTKVEVNLPEEPSGTDFDFGFSQISASQGASHVCALGSDNEVYCWGKNDYGQLGDGTTSHDPVTAPVQVSQGAIPTGVNITSVSVGSNHTCAIGSDNEVYCWGFNDSGQLGDGTTSYDPVTTPVQVSQGAIPSGVSLTSISLGDSHTCVLGSDNKAYCWGWNGEGELGDNTTTSSSVPIVVSQGAIPDGVNITSISAGSYYTCVLGSDDEAYCWGSNDNGQLGNGTTGYDPVTAPVLVSQGAIPSGVNITAVSAGYHHSCALGSDNKAYCWGANDYNQLGDSTTTNSAVPVSVSQGAIPSGVNIIAISTAYYHTCAIGSDNKSYCWGDNYFGELSLDNNITLGSDVPVAVSQGAIPSGVNITAVSAGYSHTCAIGSDSRVYCWGNNELGQLGNDTDSESFLPSFVVTIKEVTVDGSTAPVGVYNGSVYFVASPHIVGDVDVVLTNIAGNSTTLNFYYYDINDPSTIPAPSIGGVDPVANYVIGGSNVKINGGDFASVNYASFYKLSNNQSSSGYCAIGSNNKAYCWGANQAGRLGNGTTTDSFIPVAVSQGAIPDGVTITDLFVGQTHTCAIGSDNKAYCWGDNQAGQLGNGTTTNSSIPVVVSQGAIPEGVTITAFSTGASHNCLLGSDNKIYCWGYDYNGYPDDPDSSPVAVSQGAIPDGVTITAISAGMPHNCVLGSDNKAYCWGHNQAGQLGNGTTTNSSIPVAVSQGAIPEGVTITAVFAGSKFTCALGSDNKAYCWGNNNYGQLGDSTTTSSSIPVAVSQGAIPSGVSLTSISLGNSHVCALGSDNKAYCWGNNNYGQLGDSTTTSSSIPVAVSQGAIPDGVTITSITVGYQDTCVLGSNDQIYCWGENWNGQLGNDVAIEVSTVPVGIIPFEMSSIPEVYFGDVEATDVTFNSSSLLTVTVPFNTNNATQIKVVNPNGLYSTYDVPVDTGTDPDPGDNDPDEGSDPNFGTETSSTNTDNDDENSSSNSSDTVANSTESNNNNYTNTTTNTNTSVTDQQSTTTSDIDKTKTNKSNSNNTTPENESNNDSNKPSYALIIVGIIVALLIVTVLAVAISKLRKPKL